MRQAIITKYIASSNTLRARIKATCDAGQITVEYDHSRSVGDNHKDVIELLRLKLEWGGPGWHYGWLEGRMVAVCDD